MYPTITTVQNTKKKPAQHTNSAHDGFILLILPMCENDGANFKNVKYIAEHTD